MNKPVESPILWRWRQAEDNPLDVYAGDTPVCQCHRASDAALIVAAVNAKLDAET